MKAPRAGWSDAEIARLKREVKATFRVTDRRAVALTRYGQEPVCFDRKPRVYERVNGAFGRVGAEPKARRRVFGVYR